MRYQKKLIFIFLMAGALSGCAKSVPDDVSWRDTKRQGMWSRAELVTSLCEKNKLEDKPRELMLKLFGTPDRSEKSISLNSNEASRTDTYQTSMLNTSSLDIEYNSADKVSHYSEGTGCLANYNPGPEKSASSQEEIYRIRKQIPENHAALKIKDLKKLWGEPDLSDINITPTFPTPLRSSLYSWRTSVNGRDYNLVESTGTYNMAPDNRSVAALTVVSLSADCPVRRLPQSNPAEPDTN